MARRAEATSGEAEPAQRDERVAAPLAEPRVPGDDARPVPAIDQVGIRGSAESAAESGAARALPVAHPRGEDPDRASTVRARRDGLAQGGIAPFDREGEQGLAAREIEAEHARGREVLAIVEPALAFAQVEKVAIPVGRRLP